MDGPETTPLFADMPALLVHFGAATTDELIENVIDDEVDSYVDLLFDVGLWVLCMTTPNLVRHANVGLEFPMDEATFWEHVHDLDREVMG